MERGGPWLSCCEGWARYVPARLSGVEVSNGIGIGIGMRVVVVVAEGRES